MNLPAGAVTVTIHRLTIAPSGANVITLTLPKHEHGEPGLRAGDGLAGTDDIVPASGAVLRNASGASFGNGIEANSVVEGTVRINNGARYVHANMRAASGIAPLLSTAAGTELGEFEYDVPGTAVFNLSASGRTYGSVTLTRSAGAATHGALGGSPWARARQPEAERRRDAQLDDERPAPARRQLLERRQRREPARPRRSSRSRAPRCRPSPAPPGSR